MKSNNPNSGFHKSKVIKTLDTSVPDPSKNQGGHIVMETMEEKVSVIEMGALVRGQGDRVWDDNCPTLRAEMGDNQPCVMHNTVVRRLTPTECERLQGFPGGWTDIPWKGKDHSPDSHRYKACGNSMAVPVMEWIGRRIETAEFDFLA
jgi:DNA (cytosine-5)-methyltransferase 1